MSLQNDTIESLNKGFLSGREKYVMILGRHVEGFEKGHRW